MKARYQQAMEWLYIACIGVAGVVMLVMTIIIPYGVFMRYVVNSPSSWPEPAGILLMVVFSFIGGAAAYRARAHIAVSTFLNMLGDKNRARTELVAELGMGMIALFMIKWGVQLVQATWYNSIAEFPGPLCGRDLHADSGGGGDAALLIERVWCGDPPPSLRVPRPAETDRRGRHPPAGRVPRPSCSSGMPVAYAMGLATSCTALWIDMPLEAIMLKISDGWTISRSSRSPLRSRARSCPRAASRGGW
jgi:TRAP-type C4-dicarboxylate transport system permease small subunit